MEHSGSIARGTARLAVWPWWSQLVQRHSEIFGVQSLLMLAPQPIADLAIYLENFQKFVEHGAAIGSWFLFVLSRSFPCGHRTAEDDKAGKREKV